MNFKTIIPYSSISAHVPVKVTSYNPYLKSYIIDQANDSSDTIIGITLKALTQAEDPTSQNATSYKNALITTGPLYYVDTTGFNIGDRIYAATSGLTNTLSASCICQVGYCRGINIIDIAISSINAAILTGNGYTMKNFTCDGTTTPIVLAPFIANKTIVFVTGALQHVKNAVTIEDNSWTYEEGSGTIIPRDDASKSITESFPSGAKGVVFYVAV